MASKIFVNLPVKDLNKSIAFFTALGYSFNPQFTDSTATCMIISEDIFAMLLTEAKFKMFTPKAISDAHTSTEVIVALSLDTRAAVETQVAKALAAGATRYSEPKDYGFMLQDGFADLDGHIWEFFYMDPANVQAQ
jgi:uncharacterized protein